MSTKVTIDNKMKHSQLSIVDGITFKDKQIHTRRKMEFLSEDDEGDSEGTSVEEEMNNDSDRKRKIFKRISPVDTSDSSSEEEMVLSAGTKQKARKKNKPVKKVVNTVDSDNGDGVDSVTGDGDDDQISVENFLDLEAEEGYSDDDGSGDADADDGDSVMGGSGDEMDDGQIGVENFLDLEAEERYSDNRIDGDGSSDDGDGDGSSDDDGDDGSSDDGDGDDDRSSDDGDGDGKNGLQWKSHLSVKALRSFEQRRSRSSHLKAMIYGKSTGAVEKGEDTINKDELGGLFHVRVEDRSQYNMVDSSLVSNNELILEWCNDTIIESVKGLFVTGSWGGEDAKKLLEEDDNGDEELLGDFEDLETGEVHKETMEDGEEEREEVRKKKKEELRKKFDRDYDNDEKEEVINNNISY